MLDGEGQAAAPPVEVGADAQAQIEAADRALETTVEKAVSGTEAPAAEPSAPAKAAPAGKPAAQPRDDAGRFAPKPPATEPPPEDEAAAPVPETTDEPTAEADERPEGEEKPEAESEVQYPEAVYRSDGNEVAIPGSRVGENGVFIPKDVWADTQQLIAMGRAAREGTIRQQLTDFGRERQRMQVSIEGALAARDAVYDQIDKMVEAEQRGDAEHGIQKFLEDLAANWRILKAEAVAKQKDIELAERDRQLSEVNEEQERARREPQMVNVLRDSVAHYGQKAGLDAEGQKALVERLNTPRFRQLAFPRATEDDVQTGAKKGDYLVDYDFIKDEVEHFLRAGGGRKQASPERLKQMEEENKRRLAAGNKAPPVAGAKGGPAPSPKLKTDFKSTAEADEAIWDKDGYKQLAGGG